MEDITEKRDNLAKQRTHLANERTLLSYIRTFLALSGFGILLIKYESRDISVIIGYLLIIIAAILLTIGILRFLIQKKQINKF
ncbi:MAG TPA: DUF202 domain-containing protein [Bacteroidales bacterium]|nr:DUF202 domain-containing protein [Bacteroidales bacterium]HPS17783.1 DUF202 domain-containing protein [Bacteroidales bacterium]